MTQGCGRENIMLWNEGEHQICTYFTYKLIKYIHMYVSRQLVSMIHRVKII